MSSVNSLLCTVLFLVIFNTNYRFLLRRNARQIISKVPCSLESRSFTDSRFACTFAEEVQKFYSLNDISRNITMLLSNGEDKGDSGEQKSEESKEEPPPAEESKEQLEETKTSSNEEERRDTPGIPPPPETKSRIPTYDEFARYRNSSRPPDSHYYGPPGPGPFDRYTRRAKGTVIKCHLLLTILGVGSSLDRAFLF